MLLALVSANAQNAVQGSILSEDSIPVAGVTVLNKRTQFATTSNEQGYYQLTARKGDTLLLKALGFVPLLYIVSKDKTTVVHQLQSQPLELKAINVIHYNYLRDSLRLRQEFKKEFDFRRPRWNEVLVSVGPVVAVNINQLYKAVSFKKNKKKARFRKILLDKEKENLVERKFNPVLIQQLTGMEGDSLTQFMLKYQPSYDQVKDISDYDLYVYIRQQYDRYRQP
ncbi:carboxypeptidase-like regulatory domain-containing protein [Chitinophaga qingshengii]|uniref:Carboxypeptidase-like regulatory domain-containing protein n=1 Tax=Chitinophaga qingshengii TaxID=1569794 RepID=A0ABR7TV35_9BACT|nr:carboxypeptidase-like regulatory domain-containing protein [Chitinophaga qingshengii]MBC9933858.1 carboxypeptidase-like regulatory domain-containing protein [Chitinophaga qingshengii]